MGNSDSLSSRDLKKIQEVVSDLFEYSKTTGSHSDAANKSIKVTEFLDSLYEQIDLNTVPFFEDDLGILTDSERLSKCYTSGYEFQELLITKRSELQKSLLKESFSKFDMWLSEIQQSLIASENHDKWLSETQPLIFFEDQNFGQLRSEGVKTDSEGRCRNRRHHGTFFKNSDNSGSDSVGSSLSDYSQYISL